jgi:aquaporin Z
MPEQNEPTAATGGAAPDPAAVPDLPVEEAPVAETAPLAVAEPPAGAEPGGLADELLGEPDVVLVEESVVVAEDPYLIGHDTDLVGYVEEPEGPGLLVRCGAEALGSFFLVLAGVGVALYSVYDQVGTLAVALAFGIAVIGGATAVGHLSGGHFNPAVTLGTAIAGRTRWADVLPYWLAQLVGGLLAASILFLTVPEGLADLVGKEGGRRGLFSAVSNGFGEHSPLAHLLASSGVTSEVTFSLVTALLVETVAVAVFVGVILGATRLSGHPGVAPVAIGLTLTALILVALPITNASLNPMRSTATAIFADTWALQQLWLFWLAPLLGAAIAGLLYRAFAPIPLEEVLEEDEEYAVA